MKNNRIRTLVVIFVLALFFGGYYFSDRSAVCVRKNASEVHLRASGISYTFSQQLEEKANGEKYQYKRLTYNESEDGSLEKYDVSEVNFDGFEFAQNDLCSPDGTYLVIVDKSTDGHPVYFINTATNLLDWMSPWGGVKVTESNFKGWDAGKPHTMTLQTAGGDLYIDSPDPVNESEYSCQQDEEDKYACIKKVINKSLTDTNMATSSDNNTDTWPEEGKELTFTGILESASITTPMDGSTDSVVVSGKKVVIREGGMVARPIDEKPQLWGTSEVLYDEIPIGAKVEVYAFCPWENYCTLSGKEDYYLRIVK